MNPTNCIPDERLSAYFDDELSRDERSAVRNHLAVCGRCRRNLDEMDLVRRGIRSVPTPAPPDVLWSRVENELAPRPHRSGRRRTPLRAAATRLRTAVAANRPRRIVVAATLAAVAITSVLLFSRSELSNLVGSGEDVLVIDRDGTLPVLAASAPFNLGPFMKSLDLTNRLPSFPETYRQTPVEAADAFWRIARKVELDWGALPPELDLESASMIERATYRMAQLVFSHSGGKVVLFVQPRGYTISFANHPTEQTVMGRRRCLRVRCGDYRAYCFTTDEATYTVIGRYDDPMLETVYAAVVDR